jgi:hypothetical protein
MRPTLFIASSLLAACTSAYVLPSSEPTSLVSKRQTSDPVVAAAAFRALVERFTGDTNLAATDPTATAQCKVDGATLPQGKLNAIVSNPSLVTNKIQLLHH